MSAFPIVRIPADAREDIEQLGRAATVELADYQGRRGCLSLNFVDVRAGKALVHGNELLALRITGYDKDKTFRQSDHTLPNIERALRGLVGADANAALTDLASYIVFDALIGNTDRHHENWGLLVEGANALRVMIAPSFDHASSLGRELTDARREELLVGGRVDWYIQKGRGGIFLSPDDTRGENPIRLVQTAAESYPDHFLPALERVRSLEREVIHSLLSQLPPARMSSTAKQFAEAMIMSARNTLVSMLK